MVVPLPAGTYPHFARYDLQPHQKKEKARSCLNRLGLDAVPTLVKQFIDAS